MYKSLLPYGPLLMVHNLWTISIVPDSGKWSRSTEMLYCYRLSVKWLPS